MILNKDRQIAVELNAVLRSNSSKFSDLLRKTTLDPKVDFINANLRGADLRNEDLSEFDFSNATFENALISGAKFNKNVTRRQLSKAADFSAQASSAPILHVIFSGSKGDIKDLPLSKTYDISNFIEEILREVIPQGHSIQATSLKIADYSPLSVPILIEVRDKSNSTIDLSSGIFFDGIIHKLDKILEDISLHRETKRTSQWFISYEYKDYFLNVSPKFIIIISWLSYISAFWGPIIIKSPNRSTAIFPNSGPSPFGIVGISAPDNHRNPELLETSIKIIKEGPPARYKTGYRKTYTVETGSEGRILVLVREDQSKFLVTEQELHVSLRLVSSEDIILSLDIDYQRDFLDWPSLHAIYDLEKI